jgi:GntR family transcriptional repressor for pyruvate dehydrogenase complex
MIESLFDEVKNTSRSRQIVDQFRKAIGSGALKIGDKLPPERELCDQLGVSRTALREAVKILEAYGVLEPTQGGGTYVTDKFAENVFDFLGFGGELDRNVLGHLLNARYILETGAVEQAADTAEDGDLVRLENLVEELIREEDETKIGLLDAQFHETMVGLSGNPILVSIYRMIYKLMTRETSEVITYPNARKIAETDHRLILEALQTRDKKKCIKHVRDHLQRTEKLIDTYFKDNNSVIRPG